MKAHERRPHAIISGARLPFCVAFASCALMAAAWTTCASSLASSPTPQFLDATGASAPPKKTLIGPVYGSIFVKYNELHYDRAAVTVSNATNTPPPIDSIIGAIAKVAGVTIPSAQAASKGNAGSNSLLKAMLVQADITIVAKRTLCDDFLNGTGGARPSAKDYKERVRIGLSCFDSISKPLADAQSGMKIDQDIYRRIAVAADKAFDSNDLGNSGTAVSPDSPDAVVVAACARNIGQMIERHFGSLQTQTSSCRSNDTQQDVSTLVLTDSELKAEYDIKDRYPRYDLAQWQHLFNKFTALKQSIDDASFGGTITIAQRDYLDRQIDAMNLSRFIKGGDIATAYQSQFESLKKVADALSKTQGTNFYAFMKDSAATANSQCGGVAQGGASRDVMFDQYDRFTAIKDSRTLATIQCYARETLSTGIGFTNLSNAQFAVQTNLAADGTTITRQIVATNTGGQFIGTALLHWCLCTFPTGKTDLFASIGAFTAGTSTSGILLGGSLRLGGKYYFTAGDSYGKTNTLQNASVGQTVPSGFSPATGTAFRFRPFVSLSIGI